MSNFWDQRWCCPAVPELRSSDGALSAAATESVRPIESTAVARILRLIIAASTAGSKSIPLRLIVFPSNKTFSEASPVAAGSEGTGGRMNASSERAFME